MAVPSTRVRLRDALGEIDITSVVHDTRAVTPGALFCCVRGERVDGHDLAQSAVGAGAVALLVERPLELGVTEVAVESVRHSMGPLAAAFWGAPSRSLRVVGVTGTSGKTTTTHILAAIFAAHGWSPALVGTLSGARTTPEATELQALLAAERDAGPGRGGHGGVVARAGDGAGASNALRRRRLHEPLA